MNSLLKTVKDKLPCKTFYYSPPNWSRNTKNRMFRGLTTQLTESKEL